MMQLSSAARGLPPEAEELARRFVEALPAAAKALFSSVLLYGPQARRYVAGEPFSLLVVMEGRSFAARAALALATDAACRGGLYELDVTAATHAELGSGSVARLASNARRDGVVLWERAAG